MTTLRILVAIIHSVCICRCKFIKQYVTTHKCDKKIYNTIWDTIYSEAVLCIAIWEREREINVKSHLYNKPLCNRKKKRVSLVKHTSCHTFYNWHVFNATRTRAIAIEQLTLATFIIINYYYYYSTNKCKLLQLNCCCLNPKC